MGNSIIFRVDGGNIYSVAMGHIYRCIRIARYLKDSKIGSIFLMKDFKEGVNFVKSAGFDVEVMDSGITQEEEAMKIISLSSKTDTPVFIDLRTPKKTLIDILNKNNITNIVFEDISIEEIEPTILINPSVTASSERRYSPGNTRYLLGTDYLILEPEIKKYRREYFSSDIKNLFVCFGGADPCNLSSRILSILLSRDDLFQINLILGPAFKYHKDIQDLLIKDTAKRVDVVVNCKDLAPLHAQSDAAITAGGTISYESMALYVPTLVLPSIDAEAYNISPFIEKGMADGVKNDVAVVPDKDLQKLIAGFIEDSNKRMTIYKQLVTHDLSGGIGRVVRQIIN